MSQKQQNGGWISLIFRVAVASLFFSAALSKYLAGFDAVVARFHAMFEETWLPWCLVEAHARVIPYVEVFIVLWLVIGYRLNLAWVFTSFVLISLSFGQLVAGNIDVAANDYNYLLLCFVGLYFSCCDRFSVDALLSKRK